MTAKIASFEDWYSESIGNYSHRCEHLTSDRAELAAAFDAGRAPLLNTLRRIATEFAEIKQPCNCGEREACSWCEIQFLLDEVVSDTEE